ncbi:hypothetical protein EYF80_034178 [Liparis tanakae]|uniref:Uncharacterized protein n=1 Tax=Liparis tanakae TaxID=230148 RepID=A0A4Z2GQK0_9TELE|nr:hypothetical protein EYF80_034178 [Liparis tanakae]
MLLKDWTAAQRTLRTMFSLDGRLPTRLLVLGAWRLHLLSAVAILCNYSVAALEALVVVSHCNEILLRIALAFTKSVAFYLSSMLRLNAFLRLTLAGVLSSRGGPDRRRHSTCSTCASSNTVGNDSSSPSCSGGGRAARWLTSALHATPALCRCSRSVGAVVSSMSAWRGRFSSTVSTLRTLCRCVRPLLSTFQVGIGYSAQVLGIVWDLSSLISKP